MKIQKEETFSHCNHNEFYTTDLPYTAISTKTFIVFASSQEPENEQVACKLKENQQKQTHPSTSQNPLSNTSAHCVQVQHETMSDHSARAKKAIVRIIPTST